VKYIEVFEISIEEKREWELQMQRVERQANEQHMV